MSKKKSSSDDLWAPLIASLAERADVEETAEGFDIRFTDAVGRDRLVHAHMTPTDWASWVTIQWDDEYAAAPDYVWKLLFESDGDIQALIATHDYLLNLATYVPRWR